MEETDGKGGSNKRRLVSKEDRLSSLPDPLLTEILSLLPIRSAVKTSILSPRWRYLWTQLTRLRFDNVSVSTVDHILRQLTSPKILSFQLHNCESDIIPHVPSWVRQICTRNPEDIQIDIWSDGKGNLMELPSCFVTCSSLVVAKLGFEFNINSADYGKIDLPKLKHLRVHLHDSNRDSMGLLIKSCPVLLDLELVTYCKEKGHVVDVSSGNLRRLSIDVPQWSKGGHVMINAPKLEEFTLRGNALLNLRYNFVEKCCGGLRKGEISVGYERDYTYIEDDYVEASRLVQAASGVTFLEINGNLLNCLLHGDRVVPIFTNLTHLTFDIDSFVDHETNAWTDLLYFVSHCPNLEVLFIRMSDYVAEEGEWIAPDCPPACLLNKLKRIEIKNLKSDDELAFLEYILSNASVLERLVVGIFHASDYNFNSSHYEGLLDRLVAGETTEDLDVNDGYDFCEALFNYSRSSLTCEVEVSGYLFSASNKESKAKGDFQFIRRPSQPSRHNYRLYEILEQTGYLGYL